MLLREEKAKVSKYKVACRSVGWGFCPLVIHPWCGTTPDSLSLLHHLCRLHTDATTTLPSPSERMALFWQQFTCQVMRSVARQLRLTTYTGPQGPTLCPAPPVDDAGNELPLSWSGACPLPPLGATASKRPRSTLWPSRSSTSHNPYRYL